MNEPVDSCIAITALVEERIDETLKYIALLSLRQRIAVIGTLILVAIHLDIFHVVL